MRQRGYVYVGGQLLALQQNGTVTWVHQDPVTKSQRLTDTDGQVIAAIDLDPWGGETEKSWNQGQQPQRYTSYLRDGNGSDEAMHRRYNRWWARFDQPDPYDGSMNLADPQSLNRYSYVQNDPVNFVDPSGLDGEALNEGIGEARNALQGGNCRGLFRGGDAANLLDRYVANGLIEVNSRPRVPGDHTGARGRFGSNDVGAVTSTATASLLSPKGVRQSAATITINRNGFYFSGRDTNGVNVSRLFDFRGFSLRQVRGAVIVHELAHVAGVIANDGDNPSQSRLNSVLVKIFCFSKNNAPVSTPATPLITELSPRPISGGGGGGRGGGFGGFGGWTSLDILHLMYGSGGGGFRNNEGPWTGRPTRPPTLRF